VVLTIAKLLVAGAVKGLIGLESMLPGGPYLKQLNTGPRVGTAYYALASDYQPGDPGLAAWVKIRLIDGLFKTANDLIVPTAGVYDQNGSANFPITERFVFPPAAGIQHSGYFGDADARRRILAWLKAAKA
jgi:hypothetical protein